MQKNNGFLNKLEFMNNNLFIEEKMFVKNGKKRG